jgi:uncharacterized SAM-binding protein YcdF (DUF218 family)
MKRFLGKTILACLALWIFQMVYYSSIIFSNSVLPDKPGVVVVFGGRTNRAPEAIRVARAAGCTQLIISDTEQEWEALQPLLKRKPEMKVQLDYHAKTTDANARNTSWMVKKLGVKSIILVTSWYHMPRALFLMRLYLAGSGVKVTPVAAEKLPGHFWAVDLFWLEIVKFWGSLIRGLWHYLFRGDFGRVFWF